MAKRKWNRRLERNNDGIERYRYYPKRDIPELVVNPYAMYDAFIENISDDTSNVVYSCYAVH